MATRSPVKDPVVRIAALAGAAWLVAYAIATFLVAGHLTARTALGQGAYLFPTVLATALALVARRAAAGSRRRVWTALAVALALWSAADVIYYYGYRLAGVERPYPSIADAMYLTSTAVAIGALLVGFGLRRWRQVSSLLLEGSIVAVAAAYLGLVVAGPELHGADALTTVVSIAYPGSNVVVLVVLVTVGLAAGRLLSPAMVLVALGFLAAAASNALYTYVEVSQDFVGGSPIDLGWQAWAVVLCVAAAVAARHPDAARSREVRPGSGLGAIVIGATLTVGIFAVDTADSDGVVADATLAVCLYVLVAVLVRLAITLRQKQRLTRELSSALEREEQLAVTDALTGLHNRRFLDEALRVECARGRRHGEAAGMLLLDVDRFKRINDRYGYPAGDLVLCDVARRLDHVARDSDVVVRLGGEEFAILVRDAAGPALFAIGERVRRAIASRPFAVPGGGEVEVTISVGGAEDGTRTARPST